MLCEKCRSSNADNAKYCAVCGAPLQAQLATPKSYQDGYSGSASGYRQRALPREPQGARRSAGAIVFYILSGLLALGCLVLPLLPHIRWLGMNGGRTYGALEYAMKLMDTNSLLYADASTQLTGVIIFAMFILPMIFQLLWAILSFMRIGAAGGVGLAGSVLYTAIGLYWVGYLYDVVKIGDNYFLGGSGSTGDWLTAAPYLAPLLGIIGIVFSSIQLSQRRRVR